MKVFRRSQAAGVEARAAGAETSPSATDLTDGVLAERDTGSILVAVGGHSHTWDALDWAAAEAAARDCPLRIVHAFRWDPAPFGNPWVMPMDGCDHESVERAVRLLKEARRRASLIAPTIRISMHVQEGAPGSSILREARRDALIVLGRSRRRGGVRLPDRSVRRQVTRHAGCPVAVIELAPEAQEGASTGHVVVLLDGTTDPALLLSFGLRSADRRGTAVTVLHSWEPLNRSARVPIDPDTIRRCTDEVPDVAVGHRSVNNPASLATELECAALLVLGSATGRLGGMRIRSASRVALQSARCPVALVGRPPARRSGREGDGGAWCTSSGGGSLLEE